MMPAELAELLAYCLAKQAEGYSLLTWNGLGFDFDVLAEESGDYAVRRNLARSHVDMMFHVVCERGFPVALAKAAQGLGLLGKPPGMCGLLAPKMWAEGRHQAVLDYVANDVAVTVAVAQAAELRGAMRWTTQRGRPSEMKLPRGWLTVAESLPLPDTSWMTNPLRRESFTAWLDSR